MRMSKRVSIIGALGTNGNEIGFLKGHIGPLPTAYKLLLDSLWKCPECEVREVYKTHGLKVKRVKMCEKNEARFWAKNADLATG